MKSRGKKRKINNTPAQGFPSALPGAMGDHAPPRGSLLGGSLARGEAPAPPPFRWSAPVLHLPLSTPQGRASERHWVSGQGRHQEGGGADSSVGPSSLAVGGVLLSPLGAGVDGLAWKPWSWGCRESPAAGPLWRKHGRLLPAGSASDRQSQKTKKKHTHAHTQKERKEKKKMQERKKR